jgi:hypothetical protein
MRRIDINNCVLRSTKLRPIDKGSENKLYYDSKLKCANLLIGSKGTIESTKVMVDGKEIITKGFVFECSDDGVSVLLNVLEGDEVVVKSLEFK